MKSKHTIIPTAMILAVCSSCSAPTGPNTQRGAVTGGLLGATAGGIIGHQSGRGWEGAALGGATGAAAGALIGNEQDRRQGY